MCLKYEAQRDCLLQRIYHLRIPGLCECVLFLLKFIAIFDVLLVERILQELGELVSRSNRLPVECKYPIENLLSLPLYCFSSCVSSIMLIR